MTKVVFKWSKWLSASLLGLLLFLLVALAGILFTNTGLNFVLWGAQKALPELKVESATGALVPRFTLTNVSYQDASLGIDADVHMLTLGMNAACFTEPALCINDVAIDGLRFNMPELPPSEPQEPEPVEESASRITTPIAINVNHLALTDIDLNILGNQVQWQQFSSALQFQGNRLRLHPTIWNDVRVQLAPSEASETDESTEVKGGDQTTPDVKAEPQDIVLPEVTLPLQIELVRFDLRRFTLEQETPITIDHLGLEVLAAEQNVSIKTLELTMPQLDATLDSNITLTGDYPLDLNLVATVKDEMAKGQKLKVAANGSVADLALNASLSGLAKAELNANVQPLKADLAFDVDLSAGKVQWPLTGKGDYHVDLDHLTAKGALSGYQLSLDTDIKGKDIPALSASIDGKGTLSQVDIDHIELDTLGGKVTGQVMANWDQPINWQAALALQNIQPGLQWPEAEGNISGKLSTNGSLTEQGGWKVQLPLLDIDGMFRGYPLNIEGELSASDIAGKGDFKVDTPRLVLSHGPNGLHAKGKLDKEWRMDVTINVPDLEKSVPDLKGTANGEVHLTGPLKAPEVKVDLDINSVKWQDLASIEHISVYGDVKPLPDPMGSLKLTVNRAHYEDNVLNDARLEFSGNQQRHELTLDVNSNVVTTRLALNGTMLNKPSLVWKGALERVEILSKQGKWLLNHPTKVGYDVDKQQASVAAHCWLQGNSSVCLDKDIVAGQQGEATLSVKDFDFSQVAMFLPQETELQGQADAHVWAKWAPKTAPQLKFDLTLPKGSVTQKLEPNVTFGWESVTLDANLANNKLEAKWLFDVTDNGDVSGHITIPNVQVEDKQIDGRLKLSTFNLDFLAPMVGQYSQLKSNIETDLAIKGPLLQPKVNGQFLIDDILLHGDITPVEIDTGRVAIDFTGYQAKLNAAIHTPDGELDMLGDADWQDLANWHTNVRIFADELKVEVPPMVKMKVIPDMTIAITPKEAKIDGDIELPWGRIVVKDLPPSAVGVSKDQVIVNSDRKPVSEESIVPFKVESNVHIKITDDFRLSAFGLKGNVEGNLKVAQRDKGPFVNGEVQIVDGEYSSFGQDLLIKEGKILMNGPVDQPYVAITAIRNPANTQDDVIAGVKVTGSADEPSLTIFSEPSMPQANALSYLLRGQDIDGESGGNAMTTTLIGLSLAQSGRVVGEIGEAFGVQDLQLDTAGSGDDSQVTVSGYVLPGLQVKYGVGIFDSVGEFTVRYRLMKDLYVEAVSGLDSAVDLLYQFEIK
ncbi:autotransporter assembly complex protein TamB [Vibrio sp. TRT 17S01]|uniref:autotransporter assembly complex protein TamB n=1 Tax=Vibrio sp. TRT 17S01 TaxID=3418505 RepID=UPI003CF38DE8